MFSCNSLRLKSAFRHCIHTGASPRLAVGALFAGALACVAATAYEVVHGEDAAGRCFYHAPWFFGIFGLLIINLVCATWLRWPWRRRHIGFVAVHYGIVFLLTGALIGYRFGFGTLVRLHKVEPVNETQMVFANHAPVVVQHSGVPSNIGCSLLPSENGLQVVFDGPFVRREQFPLSAVLSKTIPFMETGLQIEFQGYWPDFVMEEGRPASRSESPNNPAIQIRLKGKSRGVVSNKEMEVAHKTGIEVRLIHFEVLRDAAGAPVDFQSNVSFSDLSAYETGTGVISLNRPTHFPAGFWRTVLGLNTQFSQARWNPADLGESTLHICRDPGWPFKWLGSLLVFSGLTVMLFRSIMRSSS